MDILKEISKDKLIIMVTHNPELAETYSNRIIRLLDGSVIDDSNPYVSEAEAEKKKKPLKKKRSMSFLTALLLSLNNLMTKKGRTFLTSFAGSIGIIGIALILSVSSGVNAFINRVQEDTLSAYPVTLSAEEYDMNILLENFNIMCIENTYWADNAPDILEMVEMVNHPLFHVCWDTGHGNQQPLSQYESVKIIGKHLYGLHVHDNQGLDSHILPFFGSVNFDALMYGLSEVGYKGYFTFEADNMFLQPFERKTFEKDDRLMLVPLDLRIQAEKLLYNIGKHILSSYDCFEE